MKAIVIEYNEKTYKLCYTVKSVRNMSAAGFKLSDLHDAPLLALPLIFAGAFKAEQPYLSDKVITDIYDNLKDRAELCNKLIEMYTAVITAYMEDDESKAGNATWAEATI